MTLDDLVESFREFADDLVEPYLWSASLVESYADRAEAEACERRPLLTSSTDKDMCQIAVSADVGKYTKHAAVREVYYAKFTDAISGDVHKLFITNIDELTFLEPSWEDLDSEPTYLLLDDSSVQIIPTPTVEGLLEMSISHIPKTLSSVTYNLAIHSAHHYSLVYWMLHLAFEKSDADTLNVKKALDYEARFANYFGEPKGAYALKTVRTVRNDRSRGGWI